MSVDNQGSGPAQLTGDAEVISLLANQKVSLLVVILILLGAPFLGARLGFVASQPSSASEEAIASQQASDNLTIYRLKQVEQKLDALEAKLEEIRKCCSEAND